MKQRNQTKNTPASRKVPTANLDYRLSEWCHQARACFREDHEFIAWMKADLGVTDAVAQDLCLRALAFDVAKDLITWSRLRGFREIRSIEALPTRRERIEALEAAKATDRPVRSIVREWAEWKATRDMARFIAEAQLGQLPTDVEAIVRMHEEVEAMARMHQDSGGAS